ncbi:MAG: small multi-drug export protein [Cytophagales bacterium]|nr:small multi-drug export protein [Cytophagales bacterium]
MENAFFRMISIYLVGITGIWKAIPVGIALKSHPIEIGTFTALGSITTVYVLYYFGEKVKNWVTKKWSKEKLESKKGKFTTILDRYGVVGVGIICPGPFGPITSIIIGLLVIKQTKRLMPYLVLGIIFWSFALTWFAVTGYNLVKTIF